VNDKKGFRRLKTRKTPLRIQNYRKERNLTTQLVKQAKKKFSRKLCDDIKENPNHFWGFIRS